MSAAAAVTRHGADVCGLWPPGPRLQGCCGTCGAWLLPKGLTGWVRHTEEANHLQRKVEWQSLEKGVDTDPGEQEKIRRIKQ